MAHRNRLARLGVEYPQAVLSAQRRPVVDGPGETTGDLVGDMIEVLTSLCARLWRSSWCARACGVGAHGARSEAG